MKPFQRSGKEAIPKEANRMKPFKGPRDWSCFKGQGTKAISKVREWSGDALAKLRSEVVTPLNKLPATLCYSPRSLCCRPQRLDGLIVRHIFEADAVHLKNHVTRFNATILGNRPSAEKPLREKKLCQCFYKGYSMALYVLKRCCKYNQWMNGSVPGIKVSGCPSRHWLHLVSRDQFEVLSSYTFCILNTNTVFGKL